MSELYTLVLADPHATIEMVGGKGASLARLSSAGLPVPEGFHITTAAYRRFVAVSGLQDQILGIVSAASPNQTETLRAASSQIARLFAQSSIPEEIAEAIRCAYAQLGNDLSVAVRSSATAEDLPEMSFAGQHETYLNIQGEARVLDAVKRCWASLWTDRAIGYRARNGIAHPDVSLAVVVQKLVIADAAGILFTANPLTGARNQMVINAAWGLGEAIVGGQVTPDTIVVERLGGKIVEQQIGQKDVMTVRTPDGTREEPVPLPRRNQPVLNSTQVAELIHRGGQIENLFGQPMDIEWALSENHFAILQARPITALPEVKTEPTAEWKLPDPKGLYIRASIIEQLPEPLTPLFSSLSGPIIDEATRRLFSSMAGGAELKPGIRLFETINGYGYMNVNFGLWSTVRSALGQMMKMNWIFSQSEPRWRQAHDHYLAVIQDWQVKPVRDYTAVELLAGVRALFSETMTMYTVLQTGPIATALGSETIFSQLYNRLIKQKGDPEAVIFVMGFESMPIRAEESLYDLSMWARSWSDLAAHLEATPATRLAAEMESADAPVGLNPEEWSEWQRRFREHLARYGHFTYDLDFSKAVAADDPTPLLETCRMYLAGTAGSPYDRVKALVEKREQATQMMLKRLRGPKRWIFQRQLQSAQKYAPLREDGLSDLGLGYPLLRRMLRELGSRLAEKSALAQVEDVFWLTESELGQAANALDQGQSILSMNVAVEERRAAWKAEQRVSPPMVLPIGSKYMGMDIEKLTAGGVTNDPHVIKGFGSSQGRVTAPARVLLGPQDLHQMRPGDVLVAPLTTPAWTPLFALASAIVTDIGGPLSHSSIVAREYGIPAVLGTGVATRRIRSGQTITVDGGAGTVTC